MKLSLEELSSLCGSVKDLACRIPEGDAVMSLLKRTENCRRQALELLSQDLPDSSELEECTEQAGSLDIHFPEISVLKQVFVITVVFIILKEKYLDSSLKNLNFSEDYSS